MKKLFIGIFVCTALWGSLFCEEITFEEIPHIMVDNSIEWENLTLAREISLINIEKSKWQLKPDFYFTPLYKWCDGLGGSVGLTMGGSWWLPSDGTLSVKATETIEFDDWKEPNLKKGPRVSFTYSQPVGVNGRFIDPSLYKKTKIMGTRSEDIRSKLTFLQKQNALLLNAVKMYSQIDAITRGEVLKQRELKLKQIEFDFLQQKKEQGGISGNDFWSKQMEIAQLEDLLLEISFKREEATKSLCNILGVKNWSVPLIEPPTNVPVLEDDDYVSLLLEVNPELRLLDLSVTDKAFLRDIKQKDNAGKLSLGFSLNSSYNSESKIPFADFGEDGIKPEISIGYSASVSSFAESFIDSQKNKREKQGDEVGFYAVLQNKETELQQLLNKRRMLKAKLNQILNNVEFLQKQVVREEQMFKIQSTTMLSVDWASLNYLSRVVDSHAAEWELIINRMEIACMIGEDLSLFFDRR